MSRVHRTGAQEDLRRARGHAREVRHKRRSCGALPSTPQNPTGVFDRVGRGRHERLRLVARCDEVTTNTAGKTIKVDGYILEVEVSEDAGATWQLHDRQRVPAKSDDDPNDFVRAVVRRIHQRPRYRYRLRWAAVKGECVSVFTAWTPPLDPNDTTPPPAPLNVMIFQSSVNRVALRWDQPTDPDDPDTVHVDIAYSQVVLHTSPTLPSPLSSAYRIDRYQPGERISFRVPDADQGLTFYGWVRNVDENRNKSPFVPAKVGGNSDPNATPDGVQIGAGGGKEKAVFHMRGRLRVLAEADSMDLDLDEALTIKKIRCRVKQPPTGQGVVVKVWKNETALVGTVTISAGTRRAVLDGLSVPVADGDGLSVEVAQVGSTYPGRHLVVKVVME